MREGRNVLSLTYLMAVWARACGAFLALEATSCVADGSSSNACRLEEGALSWRATCLAASGSKGKIRMEQEFWALFWSLVFWGSGWVLFVFCRRNVPEDRESPILPYSAAF